MKEGGGYGWVITAMGLMDVWGLKLALDDDDASPCFFIRYRQVPPLPPSPHYSLALHSSPLPYFFSTSTCSRNLFLNL